FPLPLEFNVLVICFSDASKTYVVLKVQNLKSTTIDRRGREPCWEQDFMFEISADGKGFIIELWKKGLLWDSILGVLWIPLATVEYATDEGPGSWWRLHSEVIKNGSEIQGTKTPTSHEILLDIYFALPFGELQIKVQHSIKWAERFLAAFSFSTDTHRDLDCRGWHRETPLQHTRYSHQVTNDSQPSMDSGLSIQESKLRYFTLSHQTCVISFVDFNFFGISESQHDTYKTILSRNMQVS
uniref:C2 domain-containing protein n=1 Tax=Junco hyemalis TaxID=40217 RepID=A0A8C5JLF5_JUNHY